jgi:hypothetical protein
MQRLSHVLGLAAVTLTCLSGCSSKKMPETIAVEGTVRLDGAPVEGARVMFSPKGNGRPAEGLTDKSGRFELTTFAPRDGALPGEHVVTVMLIRVDPVSVKQAAEGSEEAAMLAVSSGHQKPPEWIVPMRYSDQTSSGLTALVSPENRKFTFDLKKRP